MINANDVITQWASEYFGRPVRSVESFGSDWAGSTMDGFYSTFSVDITFDAVEDQWEQLEGEPLEKFWAYIMDRAIKTAAAGQKVIQ